MKISALIKQLERAKELHGDKDIYMEAVLGSDVFNSTVEKVMKIDGKIVLDWRTG